MPPVLNRELIDEVIAVSDDDAIQTAWTLRETLGPARRHLRRRGAVGRAAGRRAPRVATGKRIVVIMPDSGERYVSQAFFAP